MKTIGIVGAGPAGMCAVRHVMNSTGMTPIAWEHASEIGGTWLFNPDIGNDKYGYPFHSSMYESLRADLPREIMGFPDFAFDHGSRSYVRHPVVLKYLKEYAEYFGIREHIKFEHHVDSVEPVTEGDRATRWRVDVKNLKTGCQSTTICDYLMICNGHYSVPKIPKIPGIENFEGEVRHSHDYRNPSFMRGLRVAVLGAGYSGLDITLDASEVATQVYLCHNLEKAPNLSFPTNVKLKTGIKEATEKGFFCQDGSFIEVDILILSTGYAYTFPFLSNSAGITVEDAQVKPLYKHIINMVHPTMAFIGIPTYIINFRTFDIQVRYFLKFCSGVIRLPEEEAMQNDLKQLIETKHLKGRRACDLHVMKGYSLDYLDDLIREAELEGFPKVIKDITISSITKCLSRYGIKNFNLL